MAIILWFRNQKLQVRVANELGWNEIKKIDQWQADLWVEKANCHLCTEYMDDELREGFPVSKQLNFPSLYLQALGLFHMEVTLVWLRRSWATPCPRGKSQVPTSLKIWLKVGSSWTGARLLVDHLLSELKQFRWNVLSISRMLICLEVVRPGDYAPQICMKRFVNTSSSSRFCEVLQVVARNYC